MAWTGRGVADGMGMACSVVLLHRRRRVQSMSMTSAAARTRPRTVPRTILATLAPGEDEALFPADGMAVTVAGSDKVFAAVGTGVLEVESVASADAESVGVDDTGSDTVFAAVGTEVLEVESAASVDTESVGGDDAGSDLLEDDSAFWFQVMALGWVVS